MPDKHWFDRWAEDYGLSMRRANRKFAVPRHVQKERLEIGWVNIFRIRLFILLNFGYDPEIVNWDQSPFHDNETGSQDKAILGVRSSIVPVVEGNSDVKSRWTANLTTFSQYTPVAGGPMPWSECMFKAERDGQVHERMQAFHRSRGFPKWFTVTVSPKGTYREYDIISFLEKHLEPWGEGRQWKILLADDFSAHKTDNVWALCWSRGYILLIHGGGVTPVGQTPDTDLNEHVRRNYGDKESRLLIEKMRCGQRVPKSTREECMTLMFEVLSDPELHKRASEGFKRVGQSIELHGREDDLVCREAGTFWHEATTDKYPSMRPRIDAELAAVADEYESEGIIWCEEDVKRLITPYPAHKKTDRILANLEDTFFHDDVHELGDARDDVEGTADELSDSSSEGIVEDDNIPAHDSTAVAGDENSEHASNDMEIVRVTASQADEMLRSQASISGLQAHVDGLRAMGHLRGVQLMEAELKKERRRANLFRQESPAVADAFFRLRRAEDAETLEKQRALADQNKRKRDAAAAIADRDAAKGGVTTS